MLWWLRVQTHNAGVVGSNPARVTKTTIGEESSGRPPHKIHCPRNSSEPCFWLLLRSKSSIRCSTKRRQGYFNLVMKMKASISASGKRTNIFMMFSKYDNKQTNTSKLMSKQKIMRADSSFENVKMMFLGRSFKF